MEKSKYRGKSTMVKSLPKLEAIKKYGKHGFSIPGLDIIKRAMDWESIKESDKYLLLPLNHNYKNTNEFDYSIDTNEINNNHHTLLYQPIKIPKKGDWLYEHSERGQTFKMYSTGMTNSPSKLFNTVFINILDNDLSTSFLNEKRTSILIQLMKCYFPGVNFELMKTHLSFDDLNIDRRNNYYLQFNAGQVIEKLKSKVPKKGLLIVGVTMSDIYPRDEWNFVYGLANCMDGVGVFSFRRHYDELVEERLSNELSIEESDIEMLVCKKAAFTMIHETGHLFGIKHCIYYNCLMNGHNHSLEKSVHFYCPVCLRKLSWNLKFNVKEGYSLMLEGYLDLSIKYNNKTDFNEEIEWLKKRIILLN